MLAMSFKELITHHYSYLNLESNFKGEERQVLKLMRESKDSLIQTVEGSSHRLYHPHHGELWTETPAFRYGWSGCGQAEPSPHL